MSHRYPALLLQWRSSKTVPNSPTLFNYLAVDRKCLLDKPRHGGAVSGVEFKNTRSSIDNLVVEAAEAFVVDGGEDSFKDCRVLAVVNYFSCIWRFINSLDVYIGVKCIHYAPHVSDRVSCRDDVGAVLLIPGDIVLLEVLA